nr:cytochrome c [Bacteriovorax sp. HI3]
MDFPIFHLDFLGNRLLIAIIAIIHVIMSHTMAVGGIPLITFLEWKSYKTKDKRWSELAYRILFVFFLFTTSLGAMTGVGIWFSTSLVNPSAIGSLIRVFFWAWYVEWWAFVSEVVLILCYYLTWKKWDNPQNKLRHIKLGLYLSIASWITMMIIVAILAYMMDTGSWQGTRSFWDAVFNPVYLPQLAFRTAWGMFLAGCAALCVTSFIKSFDKDFFEASLKTITHWILGWLPVVAIASYWYWSVVPKLMKSNVPSALTTQAFQHWYGNVLLYTVIGVGIIVVIAFAIWNKSTRHYIKRPVMLIPYLIGLCLIGEFERVREFIRKPYAIANYLYANTVREEDLPLLTNEGMLKYANFARIRKITPDNQIEAGKEVFKIACTRCHTVSEHGVNSIQDRLQSMFGNRVLDSEYKESLHYYILNIHLARPYMPPFPGTSEEARALTEYLATLKRNGETLAGDQAQGTKVKTDTFEE